MSYNNNSNDDDNNNGSSSSSSSSPSYKSYSFDDDTIVYDGSYNSYLRLTNCVSFVTQSPSGLTVDLPVSLYHVPTASFLFFNYDQGQQQQQQQNEQQQPQDASSVFTLLMNVDDAVPAFAAAVNGNGNNNDNNNNNNDDGSYPAACQLMDDYYQVFGSTLEEASAADTNFDSSQTIDWSTNNGNSDGNNNDDDTTTTSQPASPRFYVGPVCNHRSNGNFGLTLGVFVDPDCQLYVPKLSQAMDEYYNNNNNNCNNCEGEGDNNDNGDGDGDGNRGAGASAIRAVNQSYQQDVSCTDNNNLCSRLLDVSSNFDTCTANSFYFGVGGGGNGQHWWNPFSHSRSTYQLSQDQLTDIDSSCVGVSQALEDQNENNAWSFQDYIAQTEANAGIPPTSSSSSSLIVGTVVAIAVAVLVIVILCTRIRVRRQRNRNHGRQRKEQQQQEQKSVDVTGLDGDDDDDDELHHDDGKDGILFGSRSIISNIIPVSTKNDGGGRGSNNDDPTIATYKTGKSNGSDDSKKLPLLEPSPTKDSDTFGGLATIRNQSSLRILRNKSSYDTEQDGVQHDDDDGAFEYECA